MKITYVFVTSVLALTAAACAHESRPPQSASTSRDGVTLTNAPAPTANGDAVAMSGDLRRLCKIEDAGTAPKFEFDSATLSSTDRSELDQLSTCMTTGPLKGQSIQLVGRADPRGEAEYNMNLGATRASAVEHYLAQLGISGSRLTATSRGALDAQGHDDASWALDRRVDLRLAGQ